MVPTSEQNGDELLRLQSEVEASKSEIHEMRREENRQQTLIARLRAEAEVRAEEAAALQHRLDAVEQELVDLRAIRDALTPPELPRRPGLELAATFLPASAERVSGDFHLVAEGPRHATALVVGDVVGHGLHAARRAAFVRTAFVATAPFSDDPRKLLSWANTALVERAGTSGEDFVTAACVAYLPEEKLLRWGYAGHPAAVWMDDGSQLEVPEQGPPLGAQEHSEYVEGSTVIDGGEGLLLYTDGLTEARNGDERFGIEGVSAALGELSRASPGEALGILRSRVAAFAHGKLTDDLCMLGVRISRD